MEYLFNWPVWILFSTCTVLISRVVLVLLFASVMSIRSAFLTAYGLFPFMLVIGFLLVVTSGMQMYGFNSNDAEQWFGYIVLNFSPFGLPMIIGTPLALVFDFVRKPWRRDRVI